MCLSCLRSGRLLTRMPSMRTARRTARAGIERQLYWQFQSGDRTVLPRQRTDLLSVGPSNRGGGDSNFMRIKPAKLVRLSFPQPRRGNAWTAGFVPVLQPSVLSATRDCPSSVLPPCGRSRDPLANVKQRTKMSWLQATVVYAHKPVDRISPTTRLGLKVHSTSRSNLGQRIGLRSRACALCSAVNP